MTRPVRSTVTGQAMHTVPAYGTAGALDILARHISPATRALVAQMYAATDTVTGREVREALDDLIRRVLEGNSPAWDCVKPLSHHELTHLYDHTETILDQALDRLMKRPGLFTPLTGRAGGDADAVCSQTTHISEGQTGGNNTDRVPDSDTGGPCDADRQGAVSLAGRTGRFFSHIASLHADAGAAKAIHAGNRKLFYARLCEGVLMTDGDGELSTLHSLYGGRRIGALRRAIKTYHGRRFQLLPRLMTLL
ncbi:hypothetical protein [Eilatimonas milleporae]|uniref:Uncharacterized protein n=1 Tax=Eilatimonas milleporae TaxID=911205 RepID=A0A3M0CCX3_9PROT|nr:hypothetical protein [Eilatimonas milleporae]RMB07674.1 hypothetical protein BXY39_1761 [Eilatimonas milleporae]